MPAHAILFVHGGSTPNAADQAVIDFLVNTGGHTVTNAQDSDLVGSYTLSNYDLIMISSSVISTDAADFASAAMPIVVWESANFDEVGLATGSGGSSTGDTIEVTDATHPLAAGYAAGARVVNSVSGASMHYVTSFNAATGYESFAHRSASSSNLYGGIVAADGHRKANPPMGDDGGTYWTTVAQDMLEAAVQWVVPAPTDTTDPTITMSQIHGSGVLDSVHSAAGYDSGTDVLTVSGTAADTGGSGLATVEVRVDGGAWQSATGTTSWSIDLDVSTFPTGSFLIEARATDGAANVSTLASETVWHSPDGVWVAATVAGQHLDAVDVEGYS